MASMKAIKKRITSVNNTKKIMKAMNLVAASKLQKAKARLDDIRPMYSDIKKVMENIKSGFSEEMNIPFAEVREVKNILYLILTSDRGLCGSFNATVSKEALAYVEANKEKDTKIIAVGSKGWDYFRRRGKEVIQRCEAASEASSFADAEVLGNKVADMYSKRRPANIARPRQIAMYLAKELTPKSLPEIGDRFGGRDHTTVLYAVKKIAQERIKNPDLNRELIILEQTLKG